MADTRTTARPYRSRKQRPCDLCRARRVCCTRTGPGTKCNLCQMRGIECTYSTAPVQRRPVPPPPDAANATSAIVGADAMEFGQSGCVELDQRTLQFVGWSGDQTPDILKHGRWEAYRVGGIEWECCRVDLDDKLPSHFSVLPDQHLDAYPHFYPSHQAIQHVTTSLGRHLLRTYFKYVNSSYYLIDEASFVLERAPMTLIASMFALALPFCPEAQALDRRVFLDFNDQALHLGNRNAKLETVAAALLYVQRHTYVHRVPTTPGLTAETGALIAWTITVAEKQWRKRLWWGAYIHDKWSALTLGRPSYITDDQSDVPMITLADFDVKQTDQSSGLETLPAAIFVAMAELSVILSDVLKEFYTLHAIRNIDQISDHAIQLKVSQLSQRLDSWKLKHQYCVEPTRDAFPDATGTPQLAYHTVQITLYRATLRTRSGSIYRETATLRLLEVIALLRSLKVNRLRSFWWAMSRINFSIAGACLYSILLLSTEDSDVRFWMEKIQEYHTLLDVQSMSFDVTKLAAIRLHLLRGQARNDLAIETELFG